MDRDSLTIMKVFIENGVKVDYSHIYHAKTQNNLDLLQYLIINTKDPFGPSGVARDAIIGVKNIETAKLLVELGQIFMPKEKIVHQHCTIYHT